MNKIIDTFEKNAERHLDDAAVYFYDGYLQKRTYRDLCRDIDSAIEFLQKKQVKRGDKVFIFAPASYRLTVFMVAAFKLGLRVLFIDIHARQETFKKLFTKFQPDYAVVSNMTRLLKPFFRALKRGTKSINIDKIALGKKSIKVELPDLPDDEPALLTTTTGSTGLPKIIVRSYEDLFRQLELINNNLPKLKTTVCMSTSYIYTFACLVNGHTVVLPPFKLKDKPQKINKSLEKLINIPISLIITTPVFGLKARNVFPALEQLYIGGASININEAKKIRSEFASCKLDLVYGATECNIMAHTSIENYINNLQKDYRSTLGKPFKGVSIRIAEDDSIYVSCNALIKGFINDKRDYEYRKIDWYNTNDKGFIEDGQLFYRGKYNYYVEVNGSRYYNHEIEQFIVTKFSDIKKCAVIQKRQKVYLFLDHKIDGGEIYKAVLDRYGAKLNFRYLRKIPRDPRHHTKTDYKRLLKMI